MKLRICMLMNWISDGGDAGGNEDDGRIVGSG